MIVSIIGKLEDVGREECLVLGGIAILRGIFEKNGIRVAGNILMGVYGDQGGGIKGGIDVVREETLSEARNYGVVRDFWKCCEVGDILELLMVDGRPLVRRHRGLSPACRLAAEQTGILVVIRGRTSEA
jgi:hypothetical protein